MSNVPIITSKTIYHYKHFTGNLFPSIRRTILQKLLHTIHSLRRKRPHLILLPSSLWATIKDLHREPTPEPRFQHSPRNIFNWQIPTVIRHRSIVMTPATPRPQPTNCLVLQRRRHLIRIRDLQQIDFITGNRSRKFIHTRLKPLL